MKKLMTLAALVAACAPAFTAEVESSNTVGYQKMSPSTQYTLIGTQFRNVGGASKTIQDMFSSVNLPGLDDNYEFQSTLQLWDGTGYQTFGWYADGDGTDGDWPEADAKWVLEDQSDIADETIGVGTGAWLNVPSEEIVSVMVSGEVVADAVTPVTIYAGYNLVSSPYPTAVDIQNVRPSSSILGLDDNYEFQTTLQVWDGTGYQTFGWYADGDGTDGDWPEADAKWVLEDQSDIAEYEIAVGTGFWVNTPNCSGTISFSK